MLPKAIDPGPKGNDAVTKTVRPVGKGTLDGKKIFTAAKTGGIQN